MTPVPGVLDRRSAAGRAASVDVRSGLRLEVDERMARRLYEQLAARPGVKPRRTALTYWATAGSIFVHVITAAVVTGAVWAAVTNPGRPLVVLLAAALLFGVVIARPRYGRLTDADLVLGRAEAPALFGLLDRIAAAAGARPAQLVRIDEGFNATYGGFGLRYSRVLTLGLLLWRSLSPQQRVAVLAHEFAHDANGDIRHLTVATTALTSLRRAFHAGSNAAAPGPVRSAAFWLAYAATWSFRSLDCRVAQRAEYLADDVATSVAGTAAVAEALDVICTGAEPAGRAVRRGADRMDHAAVWIELDAELGQLSEGQRERTRLTAARQPLRIDVYHPPVHLRVERISLLPHRAAQIELGPAEAAAIEAELVGAYKTIGKRIVNDAKAARS